MKKLVEIKEKYGLSPREGRAYKEKERKKGKGYKLTSLKN